MVEDARISKATLLELLVDLVALQHPESADDAWTVDDGAWIADWIVKQAKARR
jgi:hypothetical protein